MPAFINQMLDWLYAALVGPLFAAVGNGLAAVLLPPLAAIHLPVEGQVAVIGGLTGLLSLGLRRWLRLEERERAFRRRFARLQASQQPIGELADWRMRDELYRASDQVLDEAYNEYLARRFAWQVLVYLLPAFAALAWLDRFAPWPLASLALPATAVFAAGYGAALAAGALAGRRQRAARMAEKAAQGQERRRHGEDDPLAAGLSR